MPVDDDTPVPCEAFVERLFLLRDGSLSHEERQQVLGHLASCGRCQQAYEEIQRLEGSFEEVLTVFDGDLPDFKRRAAERLQEAGRARTARCAAARRVRRRLWWTLAAAVVAAAVLTSVVIMQRSPSGAPSEDLTTLANEKPAPEEAPPPQIPPPESLTQSPPVSPQPDAGETVPMQVSPPEPEVGSPPSAPEPGVWDVAMVSAEGGRARAGGSWRHGDAFFLTVSLPRRLHFCVIALNADLIAHSWFPRYRPNAPHGQRLDYAGHDTAFLAGTFRIPTAEDGAVYLTESGERSEFFLAFGTPEPMDEERLLSLLGELRREADRLKARGLESRDVVESLTAYLRDTAAAEIIKEIEYVVRQ